jgi:UDP-glucuronate decarboxylase
MSLDDGRVVSNFIVQALQNQPITMYGDGSQTRSFCYVDDLISGLQKLFFSTSEITGPVNLGNPVEFSILELAKEIIKLTNSNSEILFEKLPSDDPKQRKPNIAYAIEKLNWTPKVDLAAGIESSLAYFRDELKIR